MLRKIQHPKKQDRYRRQQKWLYLLDRSTATTQLLRMRILESNIAENEEEKLKVFARAIAVLYDSISNSIIHALREEFGEITPKQVVILKKFPYDVCASILLRGTFDISIPENIEE